MKKSVQLLIVSFFLLAFFAGKSQTVIFSSDFENWNGNVPTGWVGAKTTLEADSISPYTVSAHSPTHACKLVNTEATHKRFSTQPLSITNGVKYYVSYWVRGHGSIRLGLFDGRATGYGYATYTAYHVQNSATWTHYTDTITCANTTTSGEFILSTQYTMADLDHLQIDDVSITDGPATSNPLISITFPAQNATFYSSSLNVNFSVVNFIVGNPGTGIDGHIHYYLDADPVVMQYTTGPIALTGLTDGPHTLITQLVDNSHLPLVPNVADTVLFNIDLTLPNPQTIYNIQYSTATPPNSPFVNTVASTSGIITAVGSAGFFIQDGTGIWNGIYVYDNTHSPVIGDSVTITGTVKEYYGFTEFTLINGYTVHSSGNTLPAPVTVTGANIKDTIAGEAYEGVLVKIINVPCSKTANSYGEWQVFDGDTANVDDLMFHYTPVLGANYDVEGVIYLTYSHYFIEPRDINDIYSYSGINELSMMSANVSMYPNPTTDYLFISNLYGATSVKISNLLGETIKEIAINGDEAKINVGNLTTGVYIITLQNKNKIIAAKKFSKE